MTTYKYENDDLRYARAESNALAAEIMVAFVTSSAPTPENRVLVQRCFALADEFMAEIKRREEKA